MAKFGGSWKRVGRWCQIVNLFFSSVFCLFPFLLFQCLYSQLILEMSVSNTRGWQLLLDAIRRWVDHLSFCNIFSFIPVIKLHHLSDYKVDGLWRSLHPWLIMMPVNLWQSLRGSWSWVRYGKIWGKLEVGGTTMSNRESILFLCFLPFSIHPFPMPIFTAHPKNACVECQGMEIICTGDVDDGNTAM